MRRDAESPVAEAERAIAGNAPSRPPAPTDPTGDTTDVNFKNSAAYHRWLAYGHMHGVMHGGHEPVKIGGSEHHVHHGGDRGPVSGMDAILRIR